MKGSFLIYASLYCFVFRGWQDLQNMQSYDLEYYFGMVMGLLFVYLLSYWWNKVLLEQLNETMSSISKFKKVMDCSKEAICIIKDNNITYCNDIFILMF